MSEILVELVHQLEGPWRWYVIMFFLLLITGLVMRFIFKTFKWLLLLLALGIAIVFFLWQFSSSSGIL